MKTIVWMMIAAAASAASAQTPAAVRVAEDAKVVDRVAEASRKDLPRDLLRRIVNEDIDLLRGKRSDGTYQYATYERLEAGRKSDSFSIEAPDKEDRLSRVDMRGEFVYRVILDSPTRRMIVTKNRKLYIDHVEIEYIPLGASTTKVQNVKVETWLEPGANKPVDLQEIARQATVRVFARGDKEKGYGNLNVTLVEARVFDDPTSPYADAAASAKAVLRALDHDDIASIRAMASRMQQDLAPGTAATKTLDVTAPPPVAVVATTTTTPAPSAVALPSEAYGELQTIEDLLTGSDAERRQGLDRLHQLLRRIRPHS